MTMVSGLLSLHPVNESKRLRSPVRIGMETVGASTGVRPSDHQMNEYMASRTTGLG